MTEHGDGGDWKGEGHILYCTICACIVRGRPHVVLYNMCMYCKWEATYLSPIDKIPDNPTCPHKRRKARYLLEKSYKTTKQSANKPI